MTSSVTLNVHALRDLARRIARGDATAEPDPDERENSAVPGVEAFEWPIIEQALRVAADAIEASRFFDA